MKVFELLGLTREEAIDRFGFCSTRSSTARPMAESLLESIDLHDALRHRLVARS